MSDTPVLSLPEIAEGVASQATLHNEALRALEARLVRALSRTTTAPPGSPAEGDSYIVATGATGDWAGLDDQVASFIGGAWSYYTPLEGVRLWVNDDDEEVVYDGAAWGSSAGASGDVVGPGSAVDGALVAFDGTTGKLIKVASAQPFDVHAFYPGVPAASAKVLRVPVARAVSFPANFTGSYGKASAASTGTATFDIQKNGSSIGTMVFTTSASATFTTSGGAAQSMAAGDVLGVIAPSSADATLADVGLVLAGTR